MLMLSSVTLILRSLCGSWCSRQPPNTSFADSSFNLIYNDLHTDQETKAIILASLEALQKSLDSGPGQNTQPNQ